MVTRTIVTTVPLGRIRFAEEADAPAIMCLVNESVEKNFRVETASDVIYLIENCVLSICHLDANNLVVGFLSVKDYPPVPSVYPSAWEDFIWTRYKAVELNARNTIFIHMMCWNKLYAREVVDGMLRSVFMHDQYLLYIAMVKSLAVKYPLLVPGQSRAEASFRRVTAIERGIAGDQLPTLCIADRTEICPRMRIRRAVEEDNDDIVPILERHTPRIQDLYGEFYISELISRHPQSERVLLVCEHKGLAVGVMCLNTQINFEDLEEAFDLTPFAGLRHNEIIVKQSNSDNVSQTESAFEHGSSYQLETVQQAKVNIGGKVSFMEMPDGADASFTTLKNALPAFASASSFDYLNLIQDDEDMEFDIVNIDTALLRPPEMLSYDTMKSGAADYFMKMIEGQKPPDFSNGAPSYKPKKQHSAQPSEVPCRIMQFSGKSNAFLLELLAMHHEYDERYGFDILEAAYELFPTRDYCVMCLPSNHAPIPILEHFTLVTSNGSRMKFINETLYVAHVNTIKGNVRVRPAEGFDLRYVGDILEHAPRREALADLFESGIEASTLASYVLLAEKQPVGLVVLGPLEDSTAIRNRYDLQPETFRAGTDGVILAGVLSPVFEPHSRWFMRELLRQSRYTTLFWLCRLLAKGDASPSRNLMSLAGRMTPVRSRKSMPNITGFSELDKIFKEVVSPFALWFIERPITSLPKVDVNNNIVVVGASRTGLALLETLITGPTSRYLTFTNITLISTHGLPMVSECLRAVDTCVPCDGRYTDRYLKTVPFYYCIDVMSAVCVAIDRQQKCIHLKGGGIKYYDTLVLTCGQQFQHPDYLKEALEIVKEVEKEKPCERLLMDNPLHRPPRVQLPPPLPDNVLLINNIFEADQALKKLMCLIAEAQDKPKALSSTYPIIVYGDCVEAYSCMSALLELGIAARHITFVEPAPTDGAMRVNCFNDETIDDRVQASLASVGIQTYRRYSVSSWRERDGRVRSVHFISVLHAMELKCFAMFYYGRKDIDIYAFKAINESGLVYDGGLVVGPNFETNDPNIYGAGTCTRYSRRLYAEKFLHRYYSSEDVGEALARIFLKKLNPFEAATETKRSKTSFADRYSSILSTTVPISNLNQLDYPKPIPHYSKRWEPVTRFESPIVRWATLPGPLYYLKVRKPGPEVPMEVALTMPRQGHSLKTDRGGNYFHLQLNILHCVSAVTCLSKKPFYPELLAQIYGRHEGLFDNLLMRFKKHTINDLYDYFTKPWMGALYQESFNELLETITNHEVGTVYDVAKSRVNIVARSGIMEPGTPVQIKSSFACGPKVAQQPGITLHSVIEDFVVIDSFTSGTTNQGEIPSECGQSKSLRNEANAFFKTVGGEESTMAHLGCYLLRNRVVNPQYASPNEDFM